jgi:hypothetical protein
VVEVNLGLAGSKSWLATVLWDRTSVNLTQQDSSSRAGWAGLVENCNTAGRLSMARIVRTRLYMFDTMSVPGKPLVMGRPQRTPQKLQSQLLPTRDIARGRFIVSSQYEPGQGNTSHVQIIESKLGRSVRRRRRQTSGLRILE